MNTNQTKEPVWPRLASLICGLFVAISMGILVEVTRFYVFSYIEMRWAINSLPRLCRFLITLPSTELYAPHNIYILLFGISWAIFSIKAINYSKDKFYIINNIWMILHIVIGLLLSLAMIYPCLPQLKVLPPEKLHATFVTDAIAILFYLLVAVFLMKIVGEVLRSNGGDGKSR